MLQQCNAHRENEVNHFATFPMFYRGSGKCPYCGSLSPTELVKAIKSGVGVSWADRKYGWPHKLYLDQCFNGASKFYTVHLRDATEEEAKIIANVSGISFVFDKEVPGDVSWAPVVTEGK